MTMTPRQRVEAALNHHQPDRTPFFEYVLLSPLADKFLGRRYAADPDNWGIFLRERGWEDAVRQNATDRIELALLLGHDLIYAIPNPSQPLPHSAKPTKIPEISTDNPVERLRARNEKAADKAPFSDDEFLIYHLLKEDMHRRNVDLPILAPAYRHGVWTDVDLMQTMILAPEVAHEHFSIATRHSLALIEEYFTIGIDQIGVGGDFSGTRPLISPDAYREFIMPQVRTLSRRIHQNGGYAINASDGNLWSVIDAFLTGCEVDGYLEIDMFAGMDLRKLKAAYGDRVTFYGNIDCGNLLSFATPEEIRKQTIACLEAGMGNGGHIFCASNAITASIPPENYLTMVNAYREMFGLATLRMDSQQAN
ncbi:hypothetical protein JXJ21_14300 [candidate division KSB1 bacterium]|nr:hypothetical protein [candidate division KSB1 bacterium]